jgi:hypothetical protein
MRFENVTVSLTAFAASEKKKFISLLIASGQTKDLNGKWKKYRDACPKNKKKKS